MKDFAVGMTAKGYLLLQYGQMTAAYSTQVSSGMKGGALTASYLKG
jgi:hypothetical protein